MKNHRSRHRADQAEWEKECRSDALFRLLVDELSSLRLCVGRRDGSTHLRPQSRKPLGPFGQVRRAVLDVGGLLYVSTTMNI